MERAARLIRNSKYSQQIFNEEDLARAIWPAAVGKVIAAHTSRLRLARTTLIVAVEDAIWQKQLHTLSAQIIERVRRLTGSDTIQDVEFRIEVPRRQPQSATSRDSSALQDEADDIQDPVLKKVYRLSRKKATA
jgi:hypothetical protein